MTIPAPPTNPHTLAPSPKETPVSKLLVSAAQEISKYKPEDEALVLRFTGGWVRDKLLGTQGMDIGAGINSMSRYNFATQFSVYIRASMETCGFERRSMNNIEINPEMSKNLETAVPKIVGWMSTLSILGERTSLKIFRFSK